MTKEMAMVTLPLAEYNEMKRKVEALETEHIAVISRYKREHFFSYEEEIAMKFYTKEMAILKAEEYNKATCTSFYERLREKTSKHDQLLNYLRNCTWWEFRKWKKRNP